MFVFPETPVAGDPTLISVTQAFPGNSIRVEWSHPTQGANVDHYVVHYSDGNTNEVLIEGSSSTNAVITNLINDGRIYTILVEATSKHLSGESVQQSIPLRKLTGIDMVCTSRGF